MRGQYGGIEPPLNNLPNLGKGRKIVLDEIPVIVDLGMEWPTEWSYIRECEASGNAKLIGHYRHDETTVIFRYSLYTDETME